MRRAHGASTMAALAALLAAGSAHGAGFAIKEQSATALGNAFAGATAGAEDLSYMFFNPAVLGRFDGNQAQLAVSGILTKLDLKEATASTTAGTHHRQQQGWRRGPRRPGPGLLRHGIAA
ncbi:MAG: outer membrane protein transport protein [Geminicoccaceae bacterium]